MTRSARIGRNSLVPPLVPAGAPIPMAAAPRRPPSILMPVALVSPTSSRLFSVVLALQRLEWAREAHEKTCVAVPAITSNNQSR